MSPICHSAAATDVHHDKSEAEIGNKLLMRLSRKRLSARANAFIFPRLSPLPAYTAESDVYEDNEDSKLNERSKSQKGELRMDFTIQGQSINLKIPL